MCMGMFPDVSMSDKIKPLTISVIVINLYPLKELLLCLCVCLSKWGHVHMSAVP